MQTIAIDIPDEMIQTYQNPERLKRIMLEYFVANEYRKGNISMRQGAKLLGLTYQQFMIDFLGVRKISVINRTSEELALESEQENQWLDEVLGVAA